MYSQITTSIGSTQQLKQDKTHIKHFPPLPDTLGELAKYRGVEATDPSNQTGEKKGKRDEGAGEGSDSIIK